MSNDYQDREVLLQIKRNFTSNETIKHLMNENKRLQLEIGVLKSEVQELNHVLSETIRKKTKVERDEYINSILGQLDSQRTKKNEYKKQMTEWRDKYYSEKNKTQNI